MNQRVFFNPANCNHRKHAKKSQYQRKKQNLCFFSPITLLGSTNFIEKNNLKLLIFCKDAQYEKFGCDELTGCPFMSSVGKHWLGVTPPCQSSEQPSDVSACLVMLNINIYTK